MAAATTLAVVAIVATVLGAGATAYSRHRAGQAEKGKAKYQEQISRNNKVIADRAAEDARARGAIEERQQRLRTSAEIGRLNAAAAARGVEVGTGSALDLTSDAAAFGELDALTIRSNTEREALGFEVAGTGFEADANLRALEASEAKTAANIRIGTTALSAASSVSSKWTTYKNEGTV